jgi:hypothetical protein
MSEIWLDSAGHPIDAPPSAVAWLVRRVLRRGRPQLVYGRDGRPLYVPIAGGRAELRHAVEIEGFYRLHPVDDERRPIEEVPAAYVPRWDMPGETEVAADESGAALDELAALARTRLALAQQILACVPTLLDAAGALLRTSEAADRAITAIRDLMK